SSLDRARLVALCLRQRRPTSDSTAAAFSGFDGARLSRSRSSPTCTSARLPGPTGARPKTPIPSGSCPTFLDAEKPDFVVYLGDLVTANNVPIANASSYWGQATSPARQRGIPWASVFGNHDDMPFEWPIEWFSGPGIPEVRCREVQYSCSFKGTQRLVLMKNEVEQNAPLSRSKFGPKELWPSISNYVLQLSSPDDPKSPVLFMYFLDSGGGSYPEVISSAQAKWFERKSREINPESKVPEIIFWHIPSKAYKEVAPWFGIRKPCVGSINKESVAAQEAEFGIMDMLAKRPSAIFVVGHNHGLDWCCPYEKLWLCYARHTGYGGYGNWARGARMVEAIGEQDFSLKSWIRMEDGKVHSEVVLSS
ncbi:unnamed protein product, partial [Linum tenue]